MSNDIDFVITWVDGSDPEWLQCRSGVVGQGLKGLGEERFRDWGLLKYWFRGVEKFAPWVRKIHFVTWGHLPDWLETSHPQINIVRHEDFIPHEWLPTFSANPIELNLHRIKDLADQFVFFNDDMFLIRKTNPEDYFRDGLPCASAALAPSRALKNDWFMMPINNIAVINSHYNVHRAIGKSLGKWFNLKNGKLVFSTLLMLPFPAFYGFVEQHLPNSYLKSSFYDVWEKEGAILSETSSHKVRDRSDVNQWLIENWQFASGCFSPRTVRFGKAFYLGGDAIDVIPQACEYIRKQKGKAVCINDGQMNKTILLQAQTSVLAAFEIILPKKSSFEK